MSLDIQTLVLGPLNTNCYLVTDTKTDEVLVIDPADEASLISQRILEQNLQLKYILLTHGHFDHVMGLLELKLNFPDSPILLHEKDQFLLSSLPKRAEHWLGYRVDPAPNPNLVINDQTLADFDSQSGLKSELLAFELIHLPGHTPGSLGFYFPQAQTLFVGDVLFADGVGRTDFSYSNRKQLKNSLQKIKNLSSGTQIYPGHGEMFILD